MILAKLFHDWMQILVIDFIPSAGFAGGAPSSLASVFASPPFGTGRGAGSPLPPSKRKSYCI